MKDQDKPREQIMAELAELRQRVAELEAVEFERKRVKRQLKLVSTAIEQSTEGIAISDLGGNLLFLNDAFAAMHGYAPDELVGKHLSIFHTPEQAESVEAANRQIRETGKFSGEIWHVRRDGVTFPTIMRNSLFMDEEGKPIGMIATLRDITERVRFEEERAQAERAAREQTRALRESERRLREAQQIARLGTWEWHLRDDLFVMSEEMCDIYGIEDPEAYESLEALIDDFIHPEDRERVMAEEAMIIDSGHVSTQAFRIVRSDGEVRWCECPAPRIVERADDGSALVVIGAVQDVTEHKLSERALRESEEKYRNLFENSIEGVGITQGNRIITANEAVLEIFGYDSLEEFISIPVLDHVAPESREIFMERAGKRERCELEAPRFEFKIVRKDGEIRDVEALTRDVLFEGQRCVLSTFRDITERIRSEEERARAEEALKRRVSQLALLNEIGKKITPVLEMDSMLDRAVHLVQENFGYHHVALYSVDAEGDGLVMRAKAGKFTALFLPDHRLKMGQGMVGWVGRRGEKLLANDVNAEPRYINLYPDQMKTRSELSAPIRVGEEVVGVLDVQSAELNAFGENDVMVLETLAGQIAVGIENARLYAEVEERRTYLEAVLRAAPNAIVTHDADHRIVEWNPGAEKLFGYSRQEVVGKYIDELITTSDVLEGAVGLTQASLAGKEAHSTEALRYRKDGSPVDVLLAGSPVLRDDELIGTVVVYTDITGRRKTEEALKSRMKHLAALGQASQAVTASLDLDQVLAKIVSLASEVVAADYVSVALVDKEGRVGESADNVPGIPGIEHRIRDEGLTKWIVRSRWAVIVNEIGEDGSMIPRLGEGAPRIANPLIVKAGIKSLAGLPLVVKDRLLGVLYLHSRKPDAFRGRLPLLTSFANQAAIAIENARLYEQAEQEIAEREQVQETLQRYVERLKIQHELDEAILAVWSPEGVAQTALHHVQKLIPCRRASVTVFDADTSAATVVAALAEGGTQVGTGARIPPMDPENLETLRRGEYYVVEDMTPILRPGNVEEKIYQEGVRSFVTSPLIAQGELIGTLNLGARGSGSFTPEHMDIVREVGDEIALALYQARLHASLEAEQKRLEILVEHLPEGVLLLDGERRILLSNPVADSYLQVLADGAEDSRPRLGDALTSLADWPVEELMHSAPEGLWRELQVDGSPQRIFGVAARPVRTESHVEGWVLLIWDMTHEREVERRMRQQERLAAVGQLAGGIAHDFNNFLSSIILYSQLLLAKPHLPSDLAPSVETIMSESRRAAQLVQRVLDFGRRSMMETQPVDLVSSIEETAGILRRALPENIRLMIEVGGEECVVSADPTRIQQVVVNLVTNARDAMPEGGELRIKLSRVEVRPGEEPSTEAPGGEWVCMTVSDTGTGMSEEVQSHLFEPFFTTKQPGEGTGLGLAQVHGIIKQHEGHIGLETEVGRGTTFRVYLPVCEMEEAEGEQEESGAPSRGKGETILLVEDEQRVREAGREMLESLNYRVLTAENGRRALEVYSLQKVDLVLTDLVMPEMGGIRLAQELKDKHPQVKILAITGYAVREDAADLREAGILDVIRKPFEMNLLARAIHHALEVG